MKTPRPSPLPCDIVRDLLPLYHDGVVSETTGQAVEAHLENCPPCRQEYEVLCTDLPTGSVEEDPTVVKFAAMLKTLRKKRTRRAIKIGLLTCCLLVVAHVLLFCVPLVEIPPEDFEVVRAYRYEADGMEKFFVLYSTSNYLGKVTEDASYRYDLDSGTHVLQHKKAPLAWKVKENDYPWLPDPHRFFHLETFDWEGSGHRCTTIQINDKVVWTEEANGDDPVPDYVYAYDKYRLHDSGYDISFYINLNKEEVGLVSSTTDGFLVRWDLDGNILSGSYPIDESLFPAKP